MTKNKQYQRKGSDFLCPCGTSYANEGEYRLHRIKCDRWLHYSQSQQMLYEHICHKAKRGTKIFLGKIESTMLGVAFYRVHGYLPHVHKMKKMWMLPDYETVVRLFGTKEAYYETITNALAEEG